jgi:hypothetical protein
MDTERRNAAEERRVRKLQQIKQLLSIVLGPDVDLNQEARDVIKQWEKTVEMEVRPPGPKDSIAVPAARVPRHMRRHTRHRRRGTARHRVSRAPA